MEESNKYKPAIKELARLQMILKGKGGPIGDGPLFEQILKQQECLLKRFGLPISPEYEKYISFTAIPTETEIERKILSLYASAYAYLLSPPGTDIKYLQEAQETNEDPFRLMGELKVITHVYTIFVYEKILLQKRDTLENILQELRLVNDTEILQALGNIKFDNVEEPHELIQSLKEKGVRYLDYFLIEKADLLNDDDYLPPKI